MTGKKQRSGGGGGALTAHLERGWELLERGDLAGARVATEVALELDPSSPDARVLLGSLATAEGDPEEALELMQQAMDLDPEFLRPVLAAAEICIHQLGDLDLGFDLCDEAEELAAGDLEELLEVLLLRVEGLLVSGEEKEAAIMGDALVGISLQEPSRSLRIGRVLMELGALDAAATHLRHAAGERSHEADATYFLGLLADRAGQDAVSYLLKVLALDGQAPLPPWSVSDRAVARALERALEDVDPEVEELLGALPRTISELPPPELVCDGFDPRAFLFIPVRATATLEGQPPEADEGGMEPTHIFVYKRNLERACLGEEEMSEELAFSLEEEADWLLAPDDPPGEEA